MKKLFVIMMALALIAVMVLPAGVAAAASPQFEVSGDFVLGIADLGIVPVGSVYKGWEDQVIDYTGDIDGTQTGTCYFTYNLKSLALASVGVQTFTGTARGKTGTLTLRVLHQGFAQIGVVGETVRSSIRSSRGPDSWPTCGARCTSPSRALIMARTKVPTPADCNLQLEGHPRTNK